MPELPENNPLSLEEANRVRVLVDRMQALTVSTGSAPLQVMKEAIDRYPIAAWKCYTQWGPDGRGFELDSPDVGNPFIERACELGVRIICIHKDCCFRDFPKSSDDRSPSLICRMWSLATD